MNLSEREMEVVWCPCCGHDRCHVPTDELKAAVRARGLKAENKGPGGRLLEFRDGTNVNLEDECGYCDEKALRWILGLPDMGG